jgi:hypothetical protein
MTPVTLRQILRDANTRTDELHAQIREASAVVKDSDRKITLQDLGFGGGSVDVADVSHVPLHTGDAEAPSAV